MKKEVLLIGASQMAVDYFNVLRALELTPIVIGRSESGSEEFYQKTNHIAVSGGLKKYLHENPVNQYSHAIVAVGIEQLFESTLLLIKHGVKNILVEKPGGISYNEIIKMSEVANKASVNVFIAYNRRFYSSVNTVKKMLEKEGGCKSFHFEFTEWSHKIEPLEKKDGVKEAWFLGNSTHVIDLAFFLGGKPNQMHSISNTPIGWHKKSNFVGCGISDTGALFSYKANWAAPGRWGIEILTNQNKYILMPLEGLKVQKLGSVDISEIDLRNELDKDFKPGLFLQIKSFLEGNVNKLKTIHEQAADIEFYSKINGEN